MQLSLIFKRQQASLSPAARTLIGIAFGLALMYGVTRVFVVLDYDSDNMRRGTAALLAGINPWAPETRLPDFYNPPFSVLFLWPLLFLNARALIILGGGALFGLIFYQKAWVAAAWFLTNTFLWMVKSGGIDMWVMGTGLLLLLWSDRRYDKGYALFPRLVAYGFLLVKPQGGLLIVLFYILMRRDWKGVLLGLAVYGLPFLHLFPDWLHVVRSDPPVAQALAAHSLMILLGPVFSILVAIFVTVSRRWKFWQLGGALAGILAPYGMPGVPIFLSLTAVDNLAAIPAVVLFSAGLAALTWKEPMTLMEGIYHLSMLGLALVLACLSEGDPPGPLVVSVSDRVRRWLPFGNGKRMGTEKH